eukprot:1136471-Pelagomonas_calceolata.AAC.14
MEQALTVLNQMGTQIKGANHANNWANGAAYSTKHTKAFPLQLCESCGCYMAKPWCKRKTTHARSGCMHQCSLTSKLDRASPPALRWHTAAQGPQQLADAMYLNISQCIYAKES